MERPLVDFLRLPDLHKLPQVHDADLIRDIAHHGEIMGDEKVGTAALLLKVLQEIDDLGLNRDIQSGDRLIADHKGRL